MKAIQSTGAWFGNNQYGHRFEVLDAKHQLQVLVQELGSSHLHRPKRVGHKTIKARAYVIHAFLNDLRAGGFGLKNILNIDQRHVSAVVRLWHEQGLAAATLQTRFSILRWLATAIGKAGLIRDPSFYSIPDAAVSRVYVAQADKSWSSHEVLAVDVIMKATAVDQWVGMSFELMEAFGLRLAESILLRPILADHGGALRVEEGTKGGRTRIVAIETDHQRDVLDRAKLLAQQSTRGNFVPPGKTVQQAKDRLYTVGRKLGITKRQLGVTPHGLRHQFANDRYQLISGEPTVVRGGQHVDRELDIAARQVVTNELGHARLGITASYTGPRMRGRPASGQFQYVATRDNP